MTVGINVDPNNAGAAPSPAPGVCDYWLERCINTLKPWRGVATRYDTRAVNDRATVTIAALLIWLSS